MTLAAGSPVNSYTGTSGTNTYAFTFPVFSSGDMTVIVTSPTGTLYTLALSTDYTVSGLNPSGGPAATGSIVLVNSSQNWLTGGNLTTGWTLTVTRIVALAQNTSIRNQGDYYPETIEAALDFLTMISQQINLSLTAPIMPFTINYTAIATFSGQLIGKGTGTNDNAAAGYIGEAVRSYVSDSNLVSASNGVFVNITSISLTAGDWDVTGIVGVVLNSATITSGSLAALSIYTGNTTTDRADGDNYVSMFNPTGSMDSIATIPSYRLSLTSTTTVYLKCVGNFTGGPLKFYGRISARRMR